MFSNLTYLVVVVKVVVFAYEAGIFQSQAFFNPFMGTTLLWKILLAIYNWPVKIGSITLARIVLAVAQFSNGHTLALSCAYTFDIFLTGSGLFIDLHVPLTQVLWIFTSKQHVKHLFADRNTQQMIFRVKTLIRI